MGKLIAEYWERVLFGVVGLVGLIFSFKYMYAEKVTEASAVFAIAFLSFLYSNLSRFRRFKGLGFEAELWEDKQKEAEDLIERLKSVVAIYTSEVVLTAVTRGRLSNGPDWKENWKLFDDLVEQHNVLGQKIDFSALKKQVDDYFLFDMCMRNDDALVIAVRKGEHQAREIIKREFGSPIKDTAGHSKRISQLAEVKCRIDDPFKVGQSNNLAREILNMAEEAKKKLRGYFGIDVEFPEHETARLKAISGLYDSRPVKVTDELISWATATRDAAE